MVLTAEITDTEHEESFELPEEETDDVRIGRYSVKDYRFVQQAAYELHGRLQRAGLPLSKELHSRLHLNGDTDGHAVFMALMDITDLLRRRDALCQVIHAINRLP